MQNPDTILPPWSLDIALSERVELEDRIRYADVDFTPPMPRQNPISERVPIARTLSELAHAFML